MHCFAEVQKILGHTQVKTTQRDAHLAQGALIDAADEVAKAARTNEMAFYYP